MKKLIIFNIGPKDHFKVAENTKNKKDTKVTNKPNQDNTNNEQTEINKRKTVKSTDVK